MGSLLNPADPATAIARDRAEQYHMLLGFGVENLVYGIYVVLYVHSVKIAIQTRQLHRTFSSSVFSVSTFIMFILATLYMGIMASRFLYAFSPEWTVTSNGQLPVYYLRERTTFRNFAPSVIRASQIWLADALCIYRCFIIWRRNWWIILLPSLLLTLSLVNGFIFLVWLSHPYIWTYEQARPLKDMIYPINVTQACLTTGLITFKIWRQHVGSRAAGLNRAQSGVNLRTIIRMVVESAMISTVQQALIGILFYLDQPVLWVFHGCLVPSIGIAFALLSIRAHGAWRTSNLDIWIPQSLSGGTTLPFTPSADADDRHPDRRNRRRNHMRTMSDSVLYSPFSASMQDCDRHSSSISRISETIDVERGYVDLEKSVHDASLAMKHSRNALE